MIVLYMCEGLAQVEGMIDGWRKQELEDRQ